MTTKRLIEIVQSALEDRLCKGCGEEFYDGEDYESCIKCMEKASEIAFARLIQMDEVEEK